MRIRALFSTGCSLALLLLVSCQNTVDRSSGGTEDGERIADLIDGKPGAHSSILDEISGRLPGQDATATPTSPSPAATSAQSSTPGQCTVHTKEGRAVYQGPGTNYSIVGRLEPGYDYLVTGMYYSDDFPTWWRVDYWGSEGWINGLGAVTNFMPGAICNPHVELVDIDPPPVAPGACTFIAAVTKTVYAGPGTGYPIIGQIEAGPTYLVTGMYYGANYPTWWRLQYDSIEGWIDGWEGYTNFLPGASCNPLVELIDINLPPFAAASPAPQLQAEACYVAPIDGSANLQVYAGPALSQPVIGTTQPRQYYHATGQLPLHLPERLIRIDFNGTPGWVDASHYMFDGDGCWPIPTVDTWPTPIVTSTPSPIPTHSPTSTLAPEISPGQVTDISSMIGATTQIKGALPTTNGKTTTIEAIRVNFGPTEVGEVDGIRMLNILVQCTGVNPQNLGWGYYGSETRFECGQYIDTGFSQGWNIVQLALAIPSDGMTDVSYTLTVTVNAP